MMDYGEGRGTKIVVYLLVMTGRHSLGKLLASIQHSVTKVESRKELWRPMGK